MKKLGFVVSDRKFNHHVPKTSSQSLFKESTSSHKKKSSNHKLLLDREEVYLRLTLPGSSIPTEIFKAKYEETTSETVHGVKMKETQARFFITKILAGASKWEDFDLDTMCGGPNFMGKREGTEINDTSRNSRNGN